MHREHNIQHIWSFFQAGHGKGEHDGAGACVKRALSREQIKFEDLVKFQDACKIMDWCSVNISTRSKENSTIR